MTPRPPRPDDNRHREVQQLLPWFANGSLRTEEAAMVAQHTQTCPACRHELEQCHDLAAEYAAMKKTFGLPPLPFFAT